MGTPSTRTPLPPGLGISTAFTGGGKYVPEDSRFQILYRFRSRSASNCLDRLLIDPRRSLVRLDPLKRFPDNPLRDVERLVLQLWFAHPAPPDTNIG